MGIPKFYAFLIRRFPNIVVNTLSDEDRPDWLYFDYNSLIHPAIHTAVKDGKKEDQFHLEIFRYTMSVIKFVQPRKGIYFAIDGVAPRAKMVQQRERRYKSVMEKKMFREIKKKYGVEEDDQETWDTNAITPGTAFMENLASRLESFGKKIARGMKLKVRFSTSKMPAEGEHKIIGHIRQHPTGKHCIYGLDADLIMLSMSLTADIVLVREKMTFGKVMVDDDGNCDFNFLVIRTLKEAMGKQYDDVLKWPGVELQNLITDFIYLCFFLGNDFLPHIPSLSIKDNGINIIMNTYRVNMRKFKRPLVGDDLTVNVNFLKAILTQFANNEAQFFRTTHEDKQQRGPMKEKRYDSEMDKELARATIVAGKQPDTLLYHESGYQDRHYEYFFNWPYANKGGAKGVKVITDEFFEGVSWCLQYYFRGCPSWDWHYRYCGAPLVSDLADNLPEKLEVTFPKTEPVSPLQQLMLVLPKESGHLLPPGMAKLMTGPFYPDTFVMDAIGKTYMWECKAFLPYIESTPIFSQMSTVALSAEEELRNTNTKKSWI